MISALVISAATVIITPRPIVIPRPAPVRVAPRPAPAPQRVEPTHTPAVPFVPAMPHRKCDERKEKCK